MKHIVMQDGYEITIDEARLTNFELVDAMAELTEQDNPLAISRVVLLLLGKEERKRLYAHLRDEKGLVPAEAVSNALAEIFKSIGEVKNS